MSNSERDLLRLHLHDRPCLGLLAELQRPLRLESLCGSIHDLTDANRNKREQQQQQQQQQEQEQEQQQITNRKSQIISNLLANLKNIPNK